jgi:hypothetical protein
MEVVAHNGERGNVDSAEHRHFSHDEIENLPFFLVIFEILIHDSTYKMIVRIFQ